MEDASYGLHAKSVHGQVTMVVINKPGQARPGTSLCPGNTHGRKFIRDFEKCEILLARDAICNLNHQGVAVCLGQRTFSTRVN